MAKKSKGSRAREAARGTKLDEGASSVKIHGVIPESMVDEQVQRTGTYPFTFKSAFLLLAAGVVGGVVIPMIATDLGGDIRIADTLGISLLLPTALAFSRYFIDSDRGFCRGFWITLAVCLAGCFTACYLLFFANVLF